MNYLGGKWRLRREIAALIDAEVQRNGGLVWEPFCGSLAVTCSVKARPLVAADACLPLITLYRAIQDGWKPPDTLTEKEYEQVRAVRDPLDPLTAFAGFGCSFGGKWFGGYARGAHGRNYAAAAARSLKKKFETLGGVAFHHRAYDAIDPPFGAVVYCDPPYAGTVGYTAVDGGRFDHRAFWDTVRRWNRFATVLVSAFVAPGDFDVVAKWPVRKTLRDASGACPERVERVFRWCGSAR